MNERNFNAAIEALGEMLLNKDTQIFCLQMDVDALKSKLAEAESKLQEMQAKESGVLCARGVGVE